MVSPAEGAGFAIRRTSYVAWEGKSTKRASTLRGASFFGVEVGEDGGGLAAVYHGFQTGGVRLAYRLDAAEMAQQALHGLLADAGNFQQFVGAVANLAAFAVEGNGKTVSFIANELHDVQDGRVVVDTDGLVFTAIDVDDLFPFRD